MKNNKKLKGFTLIELLIVMAIFGIIMLGVMNIADPLAKVMNKSSAKEKSAAYVDNISEYVDSSIRFSKYVQVYKGEFFDTDYKGMPLTETEAVKKFIKNYFDGCIDSSYNLMKGKLHIMRFINTPAFDSGGAPVLVTVPTATGDRYTENGDIWETVYSFTCSDHYFDGSTPPNEIENEAAKIELEDSKMIINPEHKRDYSYYYKYGYSTFNAVKHDSDRVSFFALDNSPITLGSKGFALSIVAYPNGNREYHANTEREENAVAGATGASEPWFKSPCYMNTMSLYLINMDKLTGSSTITDIREKQDNTGNAAPVDGAIPVEKITLEDSPFSVYPLVDQPLTTDNFYIIYVLPSELYLT
jgi:prepilin-type N-terminal cleavage/methylation domain-containing protein